MGPDRFICNGSVTSVNLNAQFYSPPITPIALTYNWYLNGTLFTTTSASTLNVTLNGIWRVEVNRPSCTPIEYDELEVNISSGVPFNPIGPFSGAAGDCNPSFDLTSYQSALVSPSSPSIFTFIYYDENGDVIADPTNFSPTATTFIGIQIVNGDCDTFDTVDFIVDCIPSTCSLTLTSAAATTTQSVCLNQAINDIVYTPGGSATGVVLATGSFPTGVTGSFASGVFTITGTPTQLGTFKIANPLILSFSLNTALLSLLITFI